MISCAFHHIIFNYIITKDSYSPTQNSINHVIIWNVAKSSHLLEFYEVIVSLNCTVCMESKNKPQLCAISRCFVWSLSSLNTYKSFLNTIPKNLFYKKLDEGPNSVRK